MEFHHAPPDYDCPLCRIAGGLDCEDPWTRQGEVLERGERVTAFISSQQWPKNPGHAIVIPNAHIENMYSLQATLAGEIHELARRIALAMKASTGCEGVSTRQHNEPAGNQEVWHYHLHVFPRHTGDGLYGARKSLIDLDVRLAQADRLCRALAT